MAVVPVRKPVFTLPGVVLSNPKYAHNVASAIRACSCFGITTMLWTGKRVDPTTMDRLPREERMKGYKDVYWRRTNAHLIFFLTRSQSALSLCHTLRTLHHSIIRRKLFTSSDPKTGQSLKYFECIAIASSSFLLRIVSTCRRPSM